MANTLCVIPSSEEGYVELASTKAGRLFRKQILPMGSFVHPKLKSKSVMVDQEFAEKMIANFKAGYCPMVQFPLVDDQNRHVEDPARNLGRVVDVDFDATGVYATIDVRKHAEDIGETILGASAMLHLDYEDSASGQKVGPTLLHVAATNRPYLTNLAPYEEAVALSATDTEGDEAADELLMLTATQEPEKAMTKEEMIAALKAEHGVDVQGMLDRESAVVASLSAALEPAAEADLIQLSDTDVTVEDLIGQASAVATRAATVQATNLELETENLQLSTSVEEFQQEKAETEIDGYVHEGRILPAQRDAMLEIRLTDSAMFERLLPSTSLVELSERGVTTHDSVVTEDMTKAEDEVSRLSNKLTTTTG